MGLAMRQVDLDRLDRALTTLLAPLVHQCCDDWRLAVETSVAELLDGVALFPQTLINVRLADGSDWSKNASLAAAQERVGRELGADGRLLIRASGTEPVLRVMVEARDATRAQRCAEQLAEAARG